LAAVASAEAGPAFTRSLIAFASTIARAFKAAAYSTAGIERIPGFLPGRMTGVKLRAGNKMRF
jgi:hypothetical protein